MKQKDRDLEAINREGVLLTPLGRFLFFAASGCALLVLVVWMVIGALDLLVQLGAFGPKATLNSLFGR